MLCFGLFECFFDVFLPLQSTEQRFIDIIMIFYNSVSLETSNTSKHNFSEQPLLLAIWRCRNSPPTLNCSISMNIWSNWLKFGLLVDCFIYIITLDLDQRLDESSATVNLIKLCQWWSYILCNLNHLLTLLYLLLLLLFCAITTWNGQNISINTTASVGASRDNNQTPLGYLMGPSRVRKCSQSSLISGTVVD